MKFLTCLITLFLSLNLLGSDTKFGTAITLKDPVSLDIALTNFKEGKEVLVSAKVEKVCKSKGCWMGLSGVKEKHRVTFKEYSFFVPLSLIGKSVLVQGIIEKTEMSLEDTKHYAEDAGEDSSKITKAMSEYRIIASAVKVIK